MQVQAQVMTRDDSSGGWVPMGGGGLSNVGLRRLSRPSNNGEETPLTEYLIYGERIVDKSVSQAWNNIIEKHRIWGIHP